MFNCPVLLDLNDRTRLISSLPHKPVRLLGCSDDTLYFIIYVKRVLTGGAVIVPCTID